MRYVPEVAFVVILIPLLIGIRALTVFIVDEGGIIAGLIALIFVLTVGWLVAPHLDG